jgi:DnaJ-class molecular chaperone
MPAERDSYERDLANAVDSEGEGDQCPECHGMGEIRTARLSPDGMRLCPICNGTGSVEREYDAMDDGDKAYDQSLD